MLIFLKNTVSSEACSTVHMSSENNLLVSKSTSVTDYLLQCSEQGNLNALPHLPVEYADKVSGDLSRSLSRSGPVHFGSKKLISFKLFP